MKGVLTWLKSHLLIVICTVVVPVSLASGWIFSSKWNEKIRTGQEQRANSAYNKIKSAKVTYVIPSLLPDEPAWSETLAPNPYLTEYVAEQRDKRRGRAGGIVSEVEGFNRRGHVLAEPRLLPKPADPQQETQLKYDMLARFAGDKRLGVRSVYLDLFSGIGAGSPPDPIKLATSIQDLSERETERAIDESGSAALTIEEKDALTKLLSDRRVAEAQRRAKEISVYAGVEVFDPAGFGDKSAVIPPVARDERGSSVAPSLGEAFGWNFDYWVASDLLTAIDRANTNAGGVRANVENAVVKRIERIAIEALPVEVKADPNALGVEEPLEEAPTDAATDPSVSVTGRVSNSDFDVVHAKLTLVVDAQSLPTLFQAIAETNLMTVLDLDVREVDIWSDLREGYYYGDGAVLRVDLEVETVWLRQWTTPLMPDSVKEALGIPAEDEIDDEG